LFTSAQSKTLFTKCTGCSCPCPSTALVSIINLSLRCKSREYANRNADVWHRVTENGPCMNDGHRRFGGLGCNRVPRSRHRARALCHAGGAENEPDLPSLPTLTISSPRLLPHPPPSTRHHPRSPLHPHPHPLHPPPLHPPAHQTGAPSHAPSRPCEMPPEHSLALQHIHVTLDREAALATPCAGPKHNTGRLSSWPGGNRTVTGGCSPQQPACESAVALRRVSRTHDFACTSSRTRRGSTRAGVRRRRTCRSWGS
jgi:hypothetical protein